MQTLWRFTKQHHLLVLTSNPARIPVDVFHIALPFVKKIQKDHSKGVCRVAVLSNSLVVKFVMGRRAEPHKALEQETNRYNTRMSKLQGSAVLRMYGFYEGHTFDERHLPVACLILEDCGDRLTEAFCDLPFEDRFVPTV